MVVPTPEPGPGADDAEPLPADAPGPPWRRWLARVVRWSVGIATVVVLVQIARDQADELGSVSFDVSPGWLVPAAVLTVAADLTLPLGWRHLVAAYGWSIRRGRAVRAWALSQATRYLPTGLVAVASRVSLAATEGVPRSVAAASIAIETAVLLGWSVVIGAAAIPSSVVPLPLRALGGIGALLALATLPWTVPWAGARLPRLPDLGALRPKELAESVGVFGLSVALRAGRFVALAAAMLPLAAGDVPLVIGAAYAGVVAGRVGVTPAGIGVREGVIAAVLADRFGLGEAAAFAVVVRAWDFAFELAFLGAATWWGRRRPVTADPLR